MATYRQVYDSHHLQADGENRDQLRNPTRGNRVWATFTFLHRRHRLPFASLPPPPSHNETPQEGVNPHNEPLYLYDGVCVQPTPLLCLYNSTYKYAVA